MTLGGGLEKCFSDLAGCKKAGSCPALRLRRLFFEPNPKTLTHWTKEHGFYRKGIDSRVVFVCESPSDRRPEGSAEPPAGESWRFEVDGFEGWVCWDYTAQDGRFRKAREERGFQDCLITNAVKCGPKGNLRPGGPTDEESEACSQFLRREIEAVRPVALACMGDRALRIVLRYALPLLSFSPAIVPMTHYSARGSVADLEKRWAEEFGRLQQTLRSRGVPESI